MTTTTEIQDRVRDLLTTPEAVDEGIRCVRTFADAGLMTRDAGLVIKAEDGSEFQLTIVRSR